MSMTSNLILSFNLQNSTSILIKINIKISNFACLELEVMFKVKLALGILHVTLYEFQTDHPVEFTACYIKVCIMHKAV